MGGRHGRTSISERFETVVFHPFGRGYVTSDGIQHCAEATSTLNTYVTVESVEVPVPEGKGAIKELELGVTWSQKCDGTVDKAVGMVQAVDVNGSWANVMATAAINATAGTAYEEKTYSGILPASLEITQMPLSLRVQVKSDGTTNNAVGKVKNSSYVKVVYDIK